MMSDQYSLAVTAIQSRLHAFILSLLAHPRVLVEADYSLITEMRDLSP